MKSVHSLLKISIIAGLLVSTVGFAKGVTCDITPLHGRELCKFSATSNPPDYMELYLNKFQKGTQYDIDCKYTSTDSSKETSTLQIFDLSNYFSTDGGNSKYPGADFLINGQQPLNTDQTTVRIGDIGIPKAVKDKSYTLDCFAHPSRNR